MRHAALVGAAVIATLTAAWQPSADAQSGYFEYAGIQVTGARGWQGIAVPAQVPGAASGVADRRIPVSFHVQSFGEYARINVPKADLSGVSRISLHCGLAGTEGPAVWEIVGDPLAARPQGGDFWTPRIDPDELVAAADPSACGAAIVTVASLKAAADRRLLYVEVERAGAIYRAQLWPRELGLFDRGLVSIAWASDAQVPGDTAAPLGLRARAGLSFSERRQSLDFVYVRVMNANLYGTIELYCGPAGQPGERFAVLPPFEKQGILGNGDLSPTDPGGPCGMEISNVASLFEAILRGNVYVELRSAQTPTRVLRGQFEHPGLDAGNSPIRFPWP